MNRGQQDDSNMQNGPVRGSWSTGMILGSVAALLAALLLGMMILPAIHHGDDALAAVSANMPVATVPVALTAKPHVATHRTNRPKPARPAKPTPMTGGGCETQQLPTAVILKADAPVWNVPDTSDPDAWMLGSYRESVPAIMVGEVICPDGTTWVKVRASVVSNGYANFGDPMWVTGYVPACQTLGILNPWG